MTDLNEITRLRTWARGRFRDLGSPAFDAFLRMEEAAFAEGALSRRFEELVAVGGGG